MNGRTNDMKKALYIMGAGLIIGSAAAIYLLNKKKKEYNMGHKYKDLDKEQSIKVDAPLVKVVSNQEEPVYEEFKSSAIENMYYRHENAATIIRDSVKAIRENVKVYDKIDNEIDEVSTELDKMISED
jgi:gas vesicle protein